ncbi:MAG: hypothetical protein AMXMBFR74_30160 [Parvibaculum sp.]
MGSRIGRGIPALLFAAVQGNGASDKPRNAPGHSGTGPGKGNFRNKNSRRNRKGSGIRAPARAVTREPKRGD